MPTDLSKIKFNQEKVAFCRFKKLGKKFLVTNDIGRYFFLRPKSFKYFLEGKISPRTKTFKDLKKRGFIKDSLDIDSLVKKYRQRNDFLFEGPSLHIVVVTLRCNHKCIYCQASSRGMKEKKYDMTISTAKKVVDTVLSVPNYSISIEFQGGEPLANWKVVKFIIEYARKRNKKAKKNLSMPLVTNFSLMTKEKYNFLAKNGVTLCTSLDGPEELHNKNRPLLGDNSYQKTIQWIKEIKARRGKNPALAKLNALVTVSRYSLKYPTEIVDEYLKWGFPEIHLRPLSFLGLSGRFKKQIGYSVEEFLKFWKTAMDYIIKINLKGKFFPERGSRIILQKILTDRDPNFLDLRSPCGAGIGQMLYNFNGKVYTCDEGRMTGDNAFVIGDVKTDSYKKIISHPTLRTACMASILEDLPCDSCVYKPYCGVCPVQNYALYGNIFPPLRNTERCKLYRGYLDYLFGKLDNRVIKKVFEKWLPQRKKYQ
jgi:uncharacterized protein